MLRMERFAARYFGGSPQGTVGSRDKFVLAARPSALGWLLSFEHDTASSPRQAYAKEN
jgi:hypothetical protein